MKLIETSKASLTQATYERLRDEVLSCRLTPGERINAKELADLLEVNVGAVREALSRLTSEDLVVAEPQKGFRVAPISAEDLRDLTAVRIEIESMCLQRAISRGDVTWEAAILSAYHRLSKAHQVSAADSLPNDERNWGYLHSEFHESLVAACDSRWLLRLRAMLFRQNARYRNLSVSLTASDRDLDAEHKALMEAMLARDAGKAVKLMTTHIELTTDAVLRHVERSGLFEGQANQPARYGFSTRRSPA
ncbi:MULTISPECIES: GntR family transcriptional regulator [Paraburkholderia]|uniref:FCD domain-containing protein n=1 Tax=Paraburkholderia metrosideri TaxID=580937 RepID=A0ABW9E2V3_9BURK